MNCTSLKKQRNLNDIMVVTASKKALKLGTFLIHPVELLKVKVILHNLKARSEEKQKVDHKDIQRSACTNL